MKNDDDPFENLDVWLDYDKLIEEVNYGRDPASRS